jgi:hypothetical protein
MSHPYILCQCDITSQLYLVSMRHIVARQFVARLALEAWRLELGACCLELLSRARIDARQFAARPGEFWGDAVPANYPGPLRPLIHICAYLSQWPLESVFCARLNFLMFSISNILCIYIPTLSAVSAFIALISGWTCLALR